MRRLALLQYLLWTIGLAIEVLAITSLLRGAYKRFPVIFLYCVALFLTTVVEVASYTASYSGAKELADSWKYYYWINDALLQALVFAVVISLIYRATERAVARRALRRWLASGALVIFGLSFLIHRGPMSDLGGWMTLISRDLSFCAVILDLLLWSLLIAAKGKDQQLLMLSGGLGIQFTGAAIGQSIRQLARGALSRSFAVAMVGSGLVVASNLICLYIWWQAFRMPGAASPQAASASGTHGGAASL